MTQIKATSTDKKHQLLFYIILLLAGGSIFIFQNHTNGFIAGHHGNTSSIASALSKSLVIEDTHLVMLISKQMLDNGEVFYHIYNKFPVFEYLTLGTAMKIFEPDLAMQIYVARQIMNIFFLVALILCYKIVHEIVNEIFLALTITLLVFSSFYMLSYNDMVTNMSTPLLGFMLALLLVVRSSKYNVRKSMLIIIPMISIATGWHTYAVFIAWFIVDAIKHIKEQRKKGNVVNEIIREPSFIALVSSVSFGILILGGQTINEAILRGGDLLQTSSIQGMLRRLGMKATSDVQTFKEIYTKNLTAWHYFTALQIIRIFVMIVPFAGILISQVSPFHLTSFIPGMLFTLISGSLVVYGFIRFRDRINFKVFSVFALSGFCWAIPMRHYVAWHEHQSVFYIGLSIMYFIFFGAAIKPTLAKPAAIITCLLFIFSVYQMNTLKSSEAPRLNAITTEFQNIYSTLPQNSRVYVDCSGKFGRDKFGMDVCRNEMSADLGLGGQSLDFYLCGHYRASLKTADYVISKNLSYNQEKITNNEIVNLFKNVKP
ncbi:MAG: hypothetical protein HY755_04110 [Nitrospirae bacterium]|nr:hypothetical protein [Nitrospirota bacterium]MBI4847282.1 hypothetical protein [Nitrospirota bacterium]